MQQHRHRPTFLQQPMVGASSCGCTHRSHRLLCLPPHSHMLCTRLPKNVAVWASITGMPCHHSSFALVACCCVPKMTSNSDELMPNAVEPSAKWWCMCRVRKLPRSWPLQPLRQPCRAPGQSAQPESEESCWACPASLQGAWLPPCLPVHEVVHAVVCHITQQHAAENCRGSCLQVAAAHW